MKNIVYFEQSNHQFGHIISATNPRVNMMLSPNGNAALTISDHTGEFSPASWYITDEPANEGVYHRDDLPKH